MLAASARSSAVSTPSVARQGLYLCAGRVRAGHWAVGEDASGEGTVDVPAPTESSSVGCNNAETSDGVESGKLRLNQLERVLDNVRVREVMGVQHEVFSQSEPFLVTRFKQEPDRPEGPRLPVPP